MTNAFRRHPDVDADVAEIVAHLAAQSTTVASRFIDGLQATLAKVRRHPDRGGRRSHPDARLAELWTYPVDGFPNHLIFYLDLADDAFVLSIEHGARDSGGRLARRVDQLRGQPGSE